MKNEKVLNGVNAILNEDDSLTVGALNIATANGCMARVKDLPPLEPLFECFWYEEELSCLFASTNVGKSIFAMQIANEIAKTRMVLYVDCELSDRQFRMRYSADGKDFVFEENLRRAKIDIIKAGELADDALVNNIRDAALAIDSKVIIIDNISWLSMSSEKSTDAIKLMRKLLCLKDAYNFSILVIAHTPKIQGSEEISDNHMAGSKMLMNLFDSAFSIGKDVNDPHRRYVKQVKVRTEEYTYTKDNVMICRLVKDSETGNLYFKKEGTAPEYTLRRPSTPRPNNEVILRVARELYGKGKTVKEVEKEMGVRHGTFNRQVLSSVAPEISVNEDVPEVPVSP